MPEVQKYDDVVARVRALQKRANHMPTEVDPAQQGVVTPPTRKEESAQSQNLPSNRNELANATPSITDKQLNPGPTGTSVPNTVDGQPKDDAATSPTVPLSKIASRAASIAARVGALKKSAGAPAAPQAQAAPVSDDEAVTFGADMLVKLAATILETEEGVLLAEKVLVKSAGAEAARNLIANAQAEYIACAREAYAQEEFAKQAAANEDSELTIADQMFKSASADEQDVIHKIASTHNFSLSQIEDPLIKMAYQQGAVDAAEMMDSAEEGGAPAGVEDVEEGEPQLPGADGPVSLEQIAQIIAAAVESGEIDEATAEAVLQELAQAEGGGEGGEEGGMPEGEMVDPAMAEGAPEEVKAASALFRELTAA